MFFNVSKTQKEEQEKSKIIILGVNIERARGTGGGYVFDWERRLFNWKYVILR